MDVLRYLQTKSRSEKTRISLVGAGVLTGIIAIVWLTTLPAQFASMSAKSTDPALETDQTASVGSLFQDMKSQFGAVFKSANSIEEGEVPGETSGGEANPNTPSQDVPVMEGVGGIEEGGDEEDGSSSPEPSAMESLGKDQPIKNTENAPASATTPKIILIGTTTSKTAE